MGGYAWVTLATNDSYSLGALVLANSLKQVGTQQQLAVLVTPGVTTPMREKLSQVFNVIQEVNVLDSKDEANLRLLKRPELGITFTKLHCWRLTQFDKCVFLDADTLVLENCDELFEREELSAAPDVGWPDCFNSGVFVYRPSNETYDKLIQFAIERGSFDGGDQGLLNLYFSDWAHKDISKHLPFIYNLCSTACYSYLPAFKQFGGNAKIIHFIGATKPWLQFFDTETKTVRPSGDAQHLQDVLQRWWNIFCSLIHPNLTPDMSGLAGAFAQLTLGAPRTAEQAALDDHLRRQGWEVGNIDYLGRDSFENIWSKICETLSSEPALKSKDPSPSATAEALEEPPAEVTTEKKPPVQQVPEETDTKPEPVITDQPESTEPKEIPIPASETPQPVPEPIPPTSEVVKAEEPPKPAETPESSAPPSEPVIPDAQTPASETTQTPTETAESPKPTEVVSESPIPTPVAPPESPKPVLETPKPAEGVPESTKPAEVIQESPKSPEVVPENAKPAETTPESPKPEVVPESPNKPAEVVPESPKPAEIVVESPKPTEIVPESPKPEAVPESPKPAEVVPESPTPAEIVPESPKPALEVTPEIPKPVPETPAEPTSVVAETPKPDPEATPAVQAPESPIVAPEIPNTTPESPKVVPESPKAAPESPKSVPESPKPEPTSPVAVKSSGEKKSVKKAPKVPEPPKAEVTEATPPTTPASPQPKQSKQQALIVDTSVPDTPPPVTSEASGATPTPPPRKSSGTPKKASAKTKK